MKIFLFLTTMAIAGAMAIQAADVEVIANASVSAADISADDLKLIYLQTKSSFGGGHVEPVLLEGGAAESFLSRYIGKSDSGLRNYYKSLVFSGKGMIPKSFKSDQEVVDYVSRTKGAIGYVAAGTAGSGVKKLAVR